MRNAYVMTALLVLATGMACKQTPTETAPDAAPATPPPTVVSKPAPVPSTDFEVSDAPREYKTYVGELLKGEPVVLGLAKDGVRLEGILQIGGESVTLRGELLEDNHFVLRDANPDGKTALDGALSPEGVTAELLGEGVLKPVPFSGELKNPFGVSRKEFEHAYIGNFGPLMRLRMSLTKKGSKLTGNYRLSRGREALKFEGDISEADGHFHLVAGPKSRPTGVFDGVFLGQKAMFGHWSSPDGTKKTFFDVVELPNTVTPMTFDGGRKFGPRDVTEESKSCQVNAIVPELTNSGSRSVEEGVNGRFRAGVKKALAEDCAGATEKTPVVIEQTYEVLAVTEARVAIRTHSYRFLGGAHGAHKYGCFTVDTRAGTTRDANVGKLQPKNRAALEARVKEELKASYGTLEGTCFRADTVKLDDRTLLCVERKGALTVQFQMGEIGCYAIGAPRVTVSAEDAKGFVAGSSDLVPFFAHR